MIPKKIHYIFGLKKDFSLKEFSYINYLCIKSAKRLHSDFRISMSYVFTPKNNYWWDKTMEELIDDQYQLDNNEIVGGQTAVHAEHIADLRRLLILQERGGIYLDVDVLCLKPFDPLLFHKTVMGLEEFDSTVVGLCNAVILTQSDSSFIQRWIESFQYEFDGNDWNKMAVRVPHQLYLVSNKDIHVEPNISFFPYNWHTIVDLYCYDPYYHPWLDNSYCLHLWQSKWYHFCLRYMNKEDILNRNCPINIILRNYV